MKIKESAADKIFHLVNNTVMILLSLLMIYPLYYVLIASFSNAQQLVAHKGILLAPISPTALAYQLAFKNPMLLRTMQTLCLWWLSA